MALTLIFKHHCDAAAQPITQTCVWVSLRVESWVVDSVAQSIQAERITGSFDLSASKEN